MKQESSEALAADARRDGDALRGAIVFHQQSQSCSRCHSTWETGVKRIGPSLTERQSNWTDTYLVESLLVPSKEVRPPYTAQRVLLEDGTVIVGLSEQATQETLTLRDAAGLQHEIARNTISQINPLQISIMPDGQMAQLTSRQQFLDLVRYLMEIRDGGPERARQLQPSAALLTVNLPEYESRIDHATFLRRWGDASYRRGEALYRRVCANCHGTHEAVGSLPTSLRFAEGKFKNGHDPYAIYNTLTRGFGFMPAQTWMVPSQKYDVIHYIREAYLRDRNPGQYAAVDESYLSQLPSGDTLGPEPSTVETWSAMDYGSWLTHCFEITNQQLNMAYKGVAIRLDAGAGGVARGNRWAIFDTDTLRLAAAWSAEGSQKEKRFIDWRDIQFNGEHGVHPKVVGEIAIQNPSGPGWADPHTGSWADDQRVLGRDGRRYGPLPRSWARYRGLYQHDQNVVLAYDIANTPVLELLSTVEPQGNRAGGEPIFVRTIDVSAHLSTLSLRVAQTALPFPTAKVQFSDSAGEMAVAVAIDKLIIGCSAEDLTSTQLLGDDGGWYLKLGTNRQSQRIRIWMQQASVAVDEQQLLSRARETAAAMQMLPADLHALTKGGPRRWPQIIETKRTALKSDGPLSVEELPAPIPNPWLAQTRFTGLDFFDDGSLAVCTWDGDVWHVRGDPKSDVLRWQRIASGLYQPLGLKIVEQRIYVTCRDQLTRLNDFNGDGETDYYECFNNDHQVTEHFHEFAMGLQRDAEGNFYYAKSGRHALGAVVPQHGTLLRVSPDGAQTTILANGFRAANGVCLNPDGSFLVTDQEGFWNPKNRINWVTVDPDGPPRFYGNMLGYHDVTDTSDSAMEPPLCWITNKFDRSPGELMWLHGSTWGALDGGLLNLSYGTGKLFLVLHEQVKGLHQGGMVQLPIDAFPTGVMRGRLSPIDQRLVVCGMFAWAGDATSPGGLYQLKPTGQPFRLPVQLNAQAGALLLTFDQPIDAAALNRAQVRLRAWSIKRTKEYGSKHLDEHDVAVTRLTVVDGNRLRIAVPELQPTWCMEIQYDVPLSDGQRAAGTIHNTIHHLARPQ